MADANALDHALRSTHGHGLQRTVMQAGGGPLFSDSYNARELDVDAVTGTLAAAAGLSHLSFGLPGGLDLGLRDGRTIFGWSDEVPEAMPLALDSLYLGNANTGRLEMSVMGGSVGGLSLSPDASTVAWIEWRGGDLHDIGSPGFVFEEDLATGARRLVTVIENFTGSALVRYSPDGAWLQIGAGLLIRRTDGMALDLPGAMTMAWAPCLGSGALLRVEGNAADGFVLTSYDLATDEVTTMGPLEVDAGATVLYLDQLDVHPEDGRVLCVSPYGFPGPYETGQGARGKIQILDLESRRLSPVTSPTVSGFDHAERDQDRPRWIADRHSGSAIDVADSVSERLRPVHRLLSAAPGTVGDLAMMLLQRTFTDLEPGRSTRDPARVRVELLRAVCALQATDPSRAAEVLPILREFTFPLSMAAMGPIDPVRGIDHSGKPMVWLSIGLQQLEEERFDEYPWSDYAYYPS